MGYMCPSTKHLLRPPQPNPCAAACFCLMACPARAALKTLRLYKTLSQRFPCCNPFFKGSFLHRYSAKANPFSKVILLQRCQCKGKPFFKGTFLQRLCCILLLPFSQGYCLHIFSLSAMASGLLRFSFLKESMILSKTQLYFFDFFLVTSTISLGFRPATLVPST